MMTVHSRSLLAVATVDVNIPSPQGELTTSHAAPLSTAEKDTPATQAAHWRSSVADPGADMPQPTGQVVHVVQLSVASVELMPDLNEPVAQAEHMTSLLGVAATLV